MHRLANERGKTILFSTHDLTTAIAESDRVWLMLDNMVEEGSPEDLILKGSLSSLFKNTNLFFDQEKGDFRIKKKVKEKVIVLGNGIALNWTIKALERNGFEVIERKDNHSEDHNMEIEISYPEWKVRFQDSEIKFDSLYSLSRYIKTRHLYKGSFDNGSLNS